MQGMLYVRIKESREGSEDLQTLAVDILKATKSAYIQRNLSFEVAVCYSSSVFLFVTWTGPVLSFRTVVANVMIVPQLIGVKQISLASPKNIFVKAPFGERLPRLMKIVPSLHRSLPLH